MFEGKHEHVMSFAVVVSRPIDLFGFTLAVDKSGQRFCLPARIVDKPINRKEINLSRELRRKSIFNNQTVGFVSLFPGHRNKVIVFDMTERTVTRDIVILDKVIDSFSFEEACKHEMRFASFVTQMLGKREQKLVTSDVDQKTMTLVYSPRGACTFISGFTERYTDYHNLCNLCNIMLSMRIQVGRVNINSAIEVERNKSGVPFSTEKYAKIFGTTPQDRHHGYH